jgi:hypothetical protein
MAFAGFSLPGLNDALLHFLRLLPFARELILEAKVVLRFLCIGVVLCFSSCNSSSFSFDSRAKACSDESLCGVSVSLTMMVEIWKADMFDDTNENTATQYDGAGIIYGKG